MTIASGTLSNNHPNSGPLPGAANNFLQEMTALIPTLRAFGRALCMDPTLADDLAQETMLKAWSHRGRFQPGSNMKAWLLTILRNQYYSELRCRKFEVEDPNDEHAATMAVQPEHEAELEVEELGRALATLPRERREALLLVCASGLSYKQAAQICNCAVGTIKSRIARARDHLVSVLGPHAGASRARLAKPNLGALLAEPYAGSASQSTP